MLTTPSEVNKTIRKLKNNKAPGEDGIQNITLKMLPRKAVVYITYIYNACIKNRYYPDSWKTATVLAFPKSGKDVSKPENYRPISLLCTLSKIFERIIHKKLKTEMLEDLSQKEQFGFKSQHSTTQQLTRITEKITKAFNTKKSVGMILLDIQKAFDTVWHNGLVYKLITMGVPDYLVALIKSYLTNRKFKVKINEDYSDEKKCSAGVPQGSIIGPTLFNAYIKDLPLTENTEIALYADDTAICATSTLPSAIVRKLQTAINKMFKYYSKWKIKININKCEAIYFTQRKRRPITNIQYENQQIAWKRNVKYLGLTLDEKLTWKEHIDNNIKTAKIGMIKLLPLINPESTLKQELKLLLYNQVIRPALTYGATVWGTAAKSHMNKLQIAQNKFLRLICLRRRCTPIKELHENINQQTIEEYIIKGAKRFYEKSQYHHNEEIQKLGQYDINTLPKRHRRKLPKSLIS